MKITIIGAGSIGSAIAHELVQHETVTQVQVCDARARALRQLHEMVQDPRLRSFQVDARDLNVLAPIAEGSACIIGCAAPQANPVLAEMSIELGAHFCDLGGNDEIVRQELALDAAAREKGVWVVPNCGLAPGLVNILCLLGIGQFDEVEAAHLRVGDVPLEPEPPFNFRISWSAHKVIDDYTNDVHLIEDGQVVRCAPLTRLETIRFDTFDEMEAFCTAGSLSMLAEELAGRVRTLDHKTIRRPGHASQMAFVLGLGFAEERLIDVRTHLTYRDVLIRRMTERLGGEHRDAVLLRVVIHGLLEGKEASLVYEMIDRYDEATHMTAMKRCTSIPTATVAHMLAAGEVPGSGAAPPECVVPKAMFCSHVIERGLPITSTWHEGYVDVRDPLG
ncbi:saccharopine dehydrogenase NADP-binding domain-containing protein [Rhodocaloribacter litoris]|uniref:saccharopine dehydrogenase family protein n=1 Tax=Rhodocaloribacter litoris TaxID=2558931 RepID=UPI0014232A47|nr:saccharopine dehydrogenase C-terminal domain-containing protein [Rhodocaloribacter litoris]QXD14400.1 saccharopine dehydrogenase NADP-binding domain-containing protein [Rhodocaloribacter litoris]GIV61012.1 MAG: saccharopine dehydrogenase [Rhodothermaceae bacterium]